MSSKGNHLSWIVVKDLKAAIKFYTDVVGLELTQETPEFGWAELKGSGGATLGLAQEDPSMPFKAGANAIMTITVDDIEASKKMFQEKGARLIGEIETVPGHVKMQTFQDSDGNTMQLVELLG